MKHSTKAVFAIVATLIVACFVTARGQRASAAWSPDPKPPTYNITPLYEEVRRLARRYYPEVTSHRLENKIHFEHNTRIYLVHEPSKNGIWQDPWEERGPEKGGVYCDITIVPGPYKRALTIPHTFDKRYFTVHAMAPYSKKLDAHLAVSLKCPPGIPKEYVDLRPPGTIPDGFLKEMVALLHDFEKYVAKEPTG